ncbi:MAG: aa3-type cytochrome c oxidase subunit IV [Pseudomonadota bacterium]|nr:aa3-type cytochrome c oxidase subunit IV [Pseudomonadota bacterium]
MSKSHPAMDRKEHERTYDGFVKATILVVLGVAATLALMAMFVV